MSMRIVKSARRTDETEISLTLNLDGSGIYDVDTGCGFLNHMLELFSRHGRSTSRSPAAATCRWIITIPWRISPSCWAARSARRWVIAPASTATALYAAHG